METFGLRGYLNSVLRKWEGKLNDVCGKSVLSINWKMQMTWGGVSLGQQRGHCGWSKVNDRNSGRNELCQVMGKGVLQIPQRSKMRWCAAGGFLTVDWQNSQFILERITLVVGIRINNREARVKVARSASRWLLWSKWEVMESWPWEVMWKWWEMSRLQIYFEDRVRVCWGLPRWH